MIPQLLATLVCRLWYLAGVASTLVAVVVGPCLAKVDPLPPRPQGPDDPPRSLPVVPRIGVSHRHLVAIDVLDG